MTAIRRRSLRGVVGASTVLAIADDLTSLPSLANSMDVSGCAGAVIFQIHNGTPGTLGIDVLVESHDGGLTWEICDTLLALTANPFTGTVVAGGALNAAGVDTVGGYAFKAGPFQGPTRLAVARVTTTSAGTTWSTGSPSVIGAPIH